MSPAKLKTNTAPEADAEGAPARGRRTAPKRATEAKTADKRPAAPKSAEPAPAPVEVTPAPPAPPKKESVDPTYMTKEEFCEIGERLFGVNWQVRLSEAVVRHRGQIYRYATGFPIPSYMAQLMRYYQRDLDAGIPIQPIPPAGFVSKDGSFRPLPDSVRSLR